MGMAASQARLLSLTARLHDIEYKAQNLESQKIALATQQDELYQAYCDALDATSIKVAYMSGTSTTYVDANYSSLCTYNENRRQQLYALRDNTTGNLIVSEEVKEAYDCYGADKYTFAWAMMGFDSNFNFEDGATSVDESGSCIGIGKGFSDSSASPGLNYIDEGNGTTSLYMTGSEQMVYDNNSATDSELVELYNEIGEAEGTQAKEKALEEFRDYLYENYDTEIFEAMNLNKQASSDNRSEYDFPDMTWSDIKQEFNYYAKMWSAINEAGGCQVVDSTYESGEEGNKWFKNMVESGLVTIMAYDLSGHKGEWSETSVATSIGNNYLQEMQDDKDLKKAEAEYEHGLSIINRKDSEYDTELNKLETERSAITTEMDAIKKVKDDNVDRTFGIFS